MYLWYTFEAIHWVSLPCFVSFLSSLLSSFFFPMSKPPLLAPNYNNYNNSAFWWRLTVTQRWNETSEDELESNTQIIDVIQFLSVTEAMSSVSRKQYFRQSANFGSNYSGLKSKYPCKSVDDCCRQRNDDFSNTRPGGSLKFEWNDLPFKIRADKYTHASRIILANHIVIIVCRTINSWGQINTQQ